MRPRCVGGRSRRGRGLAEFAELGYQFAGPPARPDPARAACAHDDPTFKLRGKSGFYDGAYFYAIVRDPLATGRAHRLIEEAPYRYDTPRLRVACLARKLRRRAKRRSGRPPRRRPRLDLPRRIAASLLAGALGWTLWGGLVVALNPGLIFSVGADTTEPLGAALLLFGLLAYHRGRSRLAFALFAALCS